MAGQRPSITLMRDQYRWNDATVWVGSFTNTNVRREADRVSAPYTPTHCGVHLISGTTGRTPRHRYALQQSMEVRSYAQGPDCGIPGAPYGKHGNRGALVELPRPTDPPHGRRQTHAHGAGTARGRRQTGPLRCLARSS